MAAISTSNGTRAGREYLVCEFCSRDFDSYVGYIAHKADEHALEESLLQRRIDAESEASFPASDVPATTNPTVRLGDACADPAVLVAVRETSRSRA